VLKASPVKLRHALSCLAVPCLAMACRPDAAPARPRPALSNSGAEPPAPTAAPALAREDRYVDVTAGYDFTCAMRRSGRLDCFGNNAEGQASPPPFEFSAVATAGDARGACGLDLGGEIRCWGEATDASTPPPGRFVSVCFEDDDGCAVRADDNQVVCWGPGRTDAPPNLEAASLACGILSRCGLQADGRLECWSWWRDPTQQREEKFLSVAIGGQYACGITAPDRSLLCWGRDELVPSSPALAVPPVQAVAAGPFLLCVLDGQNHVRCVATPANGLIARPFESLLRSEPLADARAIRISCGWIHCCAVLDSGDLACWGDNSQGAAPIRRDY
jgi:hypothetical protein